MGSESLAQKTLVKEGGSKPPFLKFLETNAGKLFEFKQKENNMCFLHKWTKWEQYNAEMVRFYFKTKEKIPYIEHRQKRHCEKCGIEQDKEVRTDVG